MDCNLHSLENGMKPYYCTENLSLDFMPKSIIIKGSVKTLIDFEFFWNNRNFALLKEDNEIHVVIKDVEIWLAISGFIHKSIRSDLMILINQIEKEL